MSKNSSQKKESSRSRSSVAHGAVNFHLDADDLAQDEPSQTHGATALPVKETASLGISPAVSGTSSAAPSPMGVSSTQQAPLSEKINVAADSSVSGAEKKESSDETEKDGCTRQKCKETGQSVAMILGFVFPFFTGILMGAYYLYAKFNADFVYTCAVIWLVFVAAMGIGLLVTWRQRERDEKIQKAQDAENERLAQERVIKLAQEKADAAERKRLAELQA